MRWNSLTTSAVNSIGASISDSQPVLKLRTLLVAVAGLSRLGSVAGGTEHIINDSIEEISDSNEPLSPGERSRNDLPTLVGN